MDDDRTKDLQSEIERLEKLKSDLQKEVAGLAQSRTDGGIHAEAIAARDVVSGVKIEHHHEAARNETDPDKLRTLYLERVVRDTGLLSLQGIDPKAATCEAEACMNLDAVYTALLTQNSATEDFKERGGRMEERERLSALELLDRHKRLALLGDPGSGKTTFVHFVAYCMAGEMLKSKAANIERLTSPLPDKEGKDCEKRQPWRHGALLPVRVILRDFAARGLSNERASAADLWRFIASELKGMAMPQYAPHLGRELKEKGGLILLDGLDEVPEAGNRRVRLKRVVAEFQKTFGKCRILLTSRTYAYQKQDWRLPGFQEAVLAPFSKGQILRFIDRWYAHIAVLRSMKTADAQGKAEMLKRAAFSTRRMQELAERPLLLTLMASLHAWRGGSLPEKREELYADAVDLLLDWWESRKVERREDGRIVSTEPGIAEFLNTERDRVRAKLNELAFNAHAGQPDLQGTADIPEKDLVYGLLDLSGKKNRIDPRELIRFLEHRAGLLIQRGEKIYTFPHRTFQEYLAACHLTDLDYPYKVADLAREEPNRWREAALLAGAKAARGSTAGVWLLADALCFGKLAVKGTASTDLWGAHLAGQALVEAADFKGISQRNREIYNRVRVWLVRILEGKGLPAVERAAAGRNLAALGDPRKAVMRVDEMRFCLVPGGPFQMGDGEERHLNEHIRYDYWISRCPLTNAQYMEFVKAGGYADGKHWTEAVEAGFWKDGKFKGRYEKQFRKSPNDFGLPFNLANHPVVGVAWYEALAFTRWLTETWWERGILSGDWQIRLPSEAEWEKAARGGLEILRPPMVISAAEKGWDRKAGTEANEMQERRFPWGDQESKEKANYGETGIGTTSALGCFPSGASPYGCLDMAGNVWEWTRSLYKDYPYEPGDGREDESADHKSAGVLRGGAFDNDADGVRCAARNRSDPLARDPAVGFRCVCAPNTSVL